jgi:hypothetical protein
LPSWFEDWTGKKKKEKEKENERDCRRKEEEEKEEKRINYPKLGPAASGLDEGQLRNTHKWRVVPCPSPRLHFQSSDQR